MRKSMFVSPLAIVCAGSLFAALPDPIAWYAMDAIGADGTVADGSGNGRTLTLGSGVTVTNGVLPGSSALAFDGTASAWAKFSCPKLATRTVTFWTYLEPTNSSSIDGVPYFFNSLSYTSLYGGAGKSGTNEKSKTTAGGVQITDYMKPGEEACDAMYFPRGCWYHHVLVYACENDDPSEGSGLALFHYVDGVLRETANAQIAGHIDRATDCFIGNKDEAGSRALYGRLYDFRVYECAFSAEQAFELYEGGAHPTQPTCVGYWPMDEIVTDSSGVRRTPNRAGCAYPTFSDLAVQGDSFVATNGVIGGAIHAGEETCGRMVTTNRLAGGLTDFSLAFWIRLPYDTKNKAQRFVEFPESAQLRTSQKSRQLLWYLGYGRELKAYYKVPNGLFQYEAWSHVVMTVAFGSQGTNHTAAVKFYSNGEEVTTQFINADGRVIENAVDTIVCRPGSVVNVGGRHATTPDANNSDIDEFAIFSGVLSADQARALYVGAPQVDAGADFTTAETEPELFGSIAYHRSGVSVPKPGEYGWRLVSAPAEADGAGLVFADGLRGVAKLTVPGTYVFELYDKVSLLPRTDRVTVTKVAPAEGNQPPQVSWGSSLSVQAPAPLALSPSVTDPDGGPGTLRTTCSFVSGPGAAWFDPQDDGTFRATFAQAGEYVVRATATDGQDSSSADVTITVEAAAKTLADDLIHSWSLNATNYTEDAFVDDVTGTKISSPLSNTDKLFGEGVKGYAFQPQISTTDRYWASDVTLGETPTISDNASTRPTEQYKTISAWVRIRAADTNNVAGGILISQYQSFDIEYAHPNNPHGFSIFQQGYKANSPTATSSVSYALTHFPQPPVPFAGRWAHIAVVLDRWGVAENELWVDGVKQTSSSYEGQETRAGRANNKELLLGGMAYSSKNTGTYLGNYTNANGVVLSRGFPGIFDEVRIYNRRLNAAEIAALATFPAEQNREPVVTADATRLSTYRNRFVALPTATSFDDGLPLPRSETAEWRLADGPSTAVTFSDGRFKASVSGDYRLVRRVSDGERSGYSPFVPVRVDKSGILLIVR